MKITAAMVLALRDKTNAGVADCKRALEECEGDEERAIRWLKYKGIAVSERKFWTLVNGNQQDPATVERPSS